MGINIAAKTDTSYLFSGLSSSSGSSNLNFLSDYASIKNGSYGKLMKAYYSEDSGKSSAASSALKTSGLSQTETKAYAGVQSSTDSLKEAADALFSSKSLFEKKTVTVKDEYGNETEEKAYDTDAIYKAVNSFVDSYNSVINAVNKVDDKTVVNKAVSLTNSAISNNKMLNQIGITINEDSTLSIDKDTFSKADMSKVKTLFQGAGSFGYTASAQASLIDFAADRVVSKAATYTGNGTYGSAYNSGSIFNSYF